MAYAVILIMLGLLGPIASHEWRQGRWLPSGRWIVRSISPHAVAGVPLAGVVVSLIGLSLVWPPAVVPAFLAAIAFVGVMVASVNGGSVGRLPRALRPQRPTRTERPLERAGTERRRAG